MKANVQMHQILAKAAIILTTALLFAPPALAHTETTAVSGLLTGLLHPLSGIDHMVAMVAVGLWGAQLGSPAIYLLPIAFPMVMAFGGILGIAGVPLPGSELMIALSAVALGTAVALRARLPVWLAMAVVSVFAVFHGYAHGVELPATADPTTYATGFVIATGTLHLVGILIGNLQRFAWGGFALRGLGVGVAGLGCLFLITGGIP